MTTKTKTSPAFSVGQAQRAEYYGWIAKLSPEELREVRGPLALGAAEAGADRMRAALGGYLDPLRGTFSDKLYTPMWMPDFPGACREALRRVDARLAGRPVSAVVPAPAKPPAAKPAPQPRGFAAAVASLRNQIANSH